MENFKNYGVAEMTSQEMKAVNGGGLLAAAIGGILLGMFVASLIWPKA